MTSSTHTFYDHNEGGVGIFDIVSSYISTRIKTKRSPMNCRAVTLDTARTNANAILSDTNIKMASHDFTYQIEKSLYHPNF